MISYDIHSFPVGNYLETIYQAQENRNAYADINELQLL